MAKRHLITSALPYANGPLHIGHVAGAYLNADIYARHLRALNEDVLWVCGSDEHGAAITIRAQQEGVGPQDVVDKYHRMIKSAFNGLGISFDIYHRTTSPIHSLTASDFFLQLYQKEAFIEKETEQYFDEEASMFLADRYIKGTCPNCNNKEAYGDQCEKCGTTLSPEELIEPRSALSGAAPVKKKTTHWFLPMDKHEAWIKKWLEEGELNGSYHHDPAEWKKHVLGQCRSWVEAGLQPRAMTRDLDWGIPVPLEKGKNKVLYVWLDAPIGYISATKAWCEENGKNWQDYWQSEDSEIVHFIGKDNIVFHCIIFPIILKEHGEFNLPVNVPANEFLNLEGDKISTSRNHAVWIHEYLAELPERVDELRYVLTSILPETKDSEFTWDDYQARVNNELVAILGNFVNRCLVLSSKYYSGQVPQPPADFEFSADLEELFQENRSQIERAIRTFKFREALQLAMSGARLGNKYLAETEPWKLIKTDEERVKGIMFHSLKVVEHLSDVLAPFLPGTASRLRKMLSLSEGETLSPGKALGAVDHLFKKVEDAEIDIQKSKLKEKEQPKTTRKEMIAFEDFTKLDIAVGTIISAEKVEGADKLLKLKVDMGDETRTIVSGIAEHYAPMELQDVQVSVVVNLAPRKIKGVESQGMILMAEDEKGQLSFVNPDRRIEPGARIR